MRTFARAALVGFLLMASGCIVVSGHPSRHAHQHCHARGGKHHKQVCHSHPHGPGHH